MKQLFTLVAVLALAVSASAQDDPNLYTRCDGGVLHDGSNEVGFKVFSPSGASDYWNNDMDTDCAGIYFGAFIVDFLENAGFAGVDGELRLAPELAPGVPDLSAAPIAQVLSPPVAQSDGFNDDAAYGVPCFTLGSTDIHIVLQQRPGDSHLWINCDTTAPAGGRTYFTTNGYAGGTSIPLTYVDMDLVPGASVSGAPGDLLINGSATASVAQNESLTMIFFGPALNTQFALYFCVGGNPFLQMLPLGFTRTDHPFFTGPCPGSWAITVGLTCNTPTIAGAEFCTLYADTTDTKPNGKAKIKLGASAFLTITFDSFCTVNCFGRKDDCVLDSTIWKVQNPAGASDWFSVNHGSPSGVSTITGVSISSWDFCGFGPCWAEAGLYPSNTVVDPAGCTPDVGNPIATVSGTSACMAPGAGDWGCPLTFYNTPDVAASSGTNYHVAAQWPAGDSCMWLGSDTDGVDTSNPGSGCGLAIPTTSGCDSLFTTNNYTSAGVGFTAANWMMQINWN